MYLCALFCIVSLCISLYLHDTCATNGSFPAFHCDQLRRSGTLMIFGIAMTMSTRVHQLDEILSMVLIMMVSLALLLVHPA